MIASTNARYLRRPTSSRAAPGEDARAPVKGTIQPSSRLLPVGDEGAVALSSGASFVTHELRGNAGENDARGQGRNGPNRTCKASDATDA